MKYKSKFKKVCVLPIWKLKFNVSSVGPSSQRNVHEYMYIHIYFPPRYLEYIHTMIENGTKLQKAFAFTRYPDRNCVKPSLEPGSI